MIIKTMVTRQRIVFKSEENVDVRTRQVHEIMTIIYLRNSHKNSPEIASPEL